MKRWKLINDEMRISFMMFVHYMVSQNFLGPVFVCGLLGILWITYFAALARLRNEPPGPIPLPIIGNLLSLYNKPHLALKKLAERYGNVMTLHVGSKSFVVVNSIDVIREALTRKTHDFDGRADSFIGNMVSSGGNDLVFAEYGEKWKRHRQLCVRGLAFAAGERMSKLEKVILEESDNLVSRLLMSEKKPMDPRLDISLVIVNTICYMAFGCHHDKADPEFVRSVKYIDMIAEGFDDGLGNVADFFPWLKVLSQYSLKRLKSALAIRDDVMSSQLMRHRQSDNDTQDFTSFLLEQNKEATGDKGRHRLSDKNLELLMFDLFGAGVDTTVVAIRWAIVYLIRWPKCQQKMADEIDRFRPNKSKVRLDDIRELPYTQAVVYETLRLCSLFPISPRKAIRDTKLLGYSIKKGTNLVFNLWGVNHDEKHWSNPNEFIPERFIDKNGNLKSLRLLSFASFSIGSRGCPGAKIAKTEICLILANLVQNVKIKSANELPSLDCVSTVSYKPKPYLGVFSVR